VPPLYRCQISFAGTQNTVDLRSLFTDWLLEQGVEDPLPEEFGTSASDGTEVATAGADTPDGTALRISLAKHLEDGRYETSLTAIFADSDCEAWIDVEWIPGAAFIDPPDIGAPSLTTRILAIVDGRAGPNQIHPEPLSLTRSDVPDLVEQLEAADRELPIVVITADRWDDWETSVSRCHQIHQQIVGLAPVVLLDKEATAALNEGLGNNLLVQSGSITCFAPGLESLDAEPRAHRKVPRELYVSDFTATTKRISRILVPFALKRPLPQIYLDDFATRPGFPRHRGVDEMDLLTSLYRNEEQVVHLQNKLDLEILEHDETAGSLDASQARVRYLENRLVGLAGQGVFDATPEPAVPATASSCLEAIGYARQYLDNVEVGDTNRWTSALDEHPQSGIWASKAWQALRTMEEYALAKIEGDFDGNLFNFCDQPPAGYRPLIPKVWVAMQESEATDTDPARKEARMFPVPEEVLPAGVAYMCAHIKITQGGRPAPRIHFLDDTSGQNEKIYVGYFGEHLP